MTSGSSRMAPTRLRGLSEPYGFWNTICTVRRNFFAAPSGGSIASTPSSISVPALGFSIRVTSRASVDLPQPDSPTTASVLPVSSENEIPFTACNSAGARNQPCLMA